MRSWLSPSGKYIFVQSDEGGPIDILPNKRFLPVADRYVPIKPDYSHDHGWAFRDEGFISD